MRAWMCRNTHQRVEVRILENQLEFLAVALDAQFEPAYHIRNGKQQL